MKTFTGNGSTSGIVIGKAYNIYSSFQNIPRRHLYADDQTDSEIARLNDATECVLNEITESEEKSTLFLEEELRKVFETHRMILNDRQILPKAALLIEKRRINVEWALISVIDDIEREFKKIKNDYIKSRFNDIRQVLERVMDFLIEQTDSRALSFKEPMILIKEDFSPTDITTLITQNVIGVATEYGGEKSHTAIMCRSLDIPLVVGLQGILGQIPDFESIILDTERKTVIANPDRETIDKKYARIAYLSEREKRLKSDNPAQCFLSDGHSVALEANIDFVNEAHKVAEYNIRGIGLLRSEIIFMAHKHPPTSDEQYDVFRQIFTIVGDMPVTIRTWDMGADKSAGFFPSLHREINPSLGLRAIRICLREKRFFKTQLRALVRLGNERDIKILLPMITNISEITETRELLLDIAAETGVPGKRIVLGAMIETPAAAINIEEILRNVDFISIGSNDLIQYTLGIDRGNEYVSHLYSAYHPSVIQMLDRIIKAANFFGKDVIVCGEISSDPVMQLMLLGIGDVALSMNTKTVPITRKFLSYFSLTDCKKIAFQFSTFKTREECLALEKKLLGQYQGSIEELS